MPTEGVDVCTEREDTRGERDIAGLSGVEEELVGGETHGGCEDGEDSGVDLAADEKEGEEMLENGAGSSESAGAEAAFADAS